MKCDAVQLRDRVTARYHPYGYTFVEHQVPESSVRSWQLTSLETEEELHIGGSIDVNDIKLFLKLSEYDEIKNIFIIGNGSGFSTCCLAECFCYDRIDVIDSEKEGLDVALGSELTRLICSENYPNVSLVKGRSPKDLWRAVGKDVEYNLLFIDGHHRNNQLVVDFAAMLPHLAHQCVVVCHDVGFHRLFAGFNMAREIAEGNQFNTFIRQVDYCPSGTAIMSRGFMNVRSTVFMGG